MTTKFKLREKPTKPNRRTIRSQIEIIDGETLSNVIGQIPVNSDYDFFKFEIDTTCYNECYRDCYCSRILLVCVRPQTDVEYQEDLNRYEERLADYEQWLVDNKEAIENYIKEKEEETLRKRNKEIEGMARQLEKNRKALDKLQAQYEKALKKKA